MTLSLTDTFIIDFARGIVRELKPNNARGIKRGTKQIEGYLKELSKMPEFKNIKWTGYLDTYGF